MQFPGEHAHCGPPLDPESGFTYSPQTFMDNDSEILIYSIDIILFYISQFSQFKPFSLISLAVNMLYLQFTFTTLGCRIMVCLLLLQ